MIHIFRRKKTSMEIPIYFSQSLILVSKIFSKHFSDTSQSKPVTLKNPLTACNSLANQYIFYPYNFTCWYLTSHKMILQNRFYHISHSCRRLLIKTCVNIINRLVDLCRNLTLIYVN